MKRFREFRKGKCSDNKKKLTPSPPHSRGGPGQAHFLALAARSSGRAFRPEQGQMSMKYSAKLENQNKFIKNI